MQRKHNMVNIWFAADDKGNDRGGYMPVEDIIDW